MPPPPDPSTFNAFPPNCYDRADGSIAGIGTPTPSNAVVIKPSPIYFEEDPDSPDIERGEQATITHRFCTDSVTALTLLTGIGRGAFLTDSNGNVTRVLSHRLRWDKGNRCHMEMTAESISFDTPPDEYDIDTVELNPPLERHPNYKALINYNLDTDGNKVDNKLLSGPQVVNLLKNSVNPVSIGSANDLLALVNSTGITDASVLALANSFARKLLVGETEFYCAGIKVTWSQFYFLPVPLNGGGYIENPVTNGGLPPYVWSDTGLPGGQDTIQDFLGFYNHVIYADGVSWLRLADTRSYQRTWHKLTRTWIGGPLALWDKDIYPDIYGNLPPGP